jgi:hypothetical protein
MSNTPSLTPRVRSPDSTPGLEGGFADIASGQAPDSALTYQLGIAAGTAASLLALGVGAALVRSRWLRWRARELAARLYGEERVRKLRHERGKNGVVGAAGVTGLGLTISRVGIGGGIGGRASFVTAAAAAAAAAPPTEEEEQQRHFDREVACVAVSSGLAAYRSRRAEALTGVANSLAATHANIAGALPNSGGVGGGTVGAAGRGRLLLPPSRRFSLDGGGLDASDSAAAGVGLDLGLSLGPGVVRGGFGGGSPLAQPAFPLGRSRGWGGVAEELAASRVATLRRQSLDGRSRALLLASRAGAGAGLGSSSQPFGAFASAPAPPLGPSGGGAGTGCGGLNGSSPGSFGGGNSFSLALRARRRWSTGGSTSEAAAFAAFALPPLPSRTPAAAEVSAAAAASGAAMAAAWAEAPPPPQALLVLVPAAAEAPRRGGGWFVDGQVVGHAQLTAEMRAARLELERRLEAAVESSAAVAAAARPKGAAQSTVHLSSARGSTVVSSGGQRSAWALAGPNEGSAEAIAAEEAAEATGFTSVVASSEAPAPETAAADEAALHLPGGAMSAADSEGDSRSDDEAGFGGLSGISSGFGSAGGAGGSRNGHGADLIATAVVHLPRRASLGAASRKANAAMRGALFGGEGNAGSCDAGGAGGTGSVGGAGSAGGSRSSQRTRPPPLLVPPATRTAAAMAAASMPPPSPLLHRATSVGGGLRRSPSDPPPIPWRPAGLTGAVQPPSTPPPSARLALPLRAASRGQMLPHRAASRHDLGGFGLDG